MLQFLFRRLTAEPERGAALFASVTAEAREPHWYVEGKAPDTLDGRFAVLTTVLALVLVRLEAEGDAGNAAAVAVTERFIEVMESEHRELGLGDPTLGKTVRKLMGSLARRTGYWRSAASGTMEWADAVRASLYKADAPPGSIAHATEATQRLWSKLQKLALADIEQGRLQ